MHKTVIGDCRDEGLIEEIFGSVSEFARLVEENGDNFVFGKVSIEYDEESDIHTFILIS
jgi:hypothetical protein